MLNKNYNVLVTGFIGKNLLKKLDNLQNINILEIIQRFILKSVYQNQIL